MSTTTGTGVWKGGGGPPPPQEEGSGGGGPHDNSPGSSRRVSFTGLWVLLAAIVMFFAALVSVYVVRRGISDDWRTLPLPPSLFWNTAALILSSVSLEAARRKLRFGLRMAFELWWTGGTLLGLVFLAGQVAVWRQFWLAGYFLASNPSSALFYVLTAAHAAHLLGGVIALVYVNIQALRSRLGPGKRTVADVSAVYWHFMDGLWLFLLALFLIRG